MNIAKEDDRLVLSFSRIAYPKFWRFFALSVVLMVLGFAYIVWAMLGNTEELMTLSRMGILALTFFPSLLYVSSKLMDGAYEPVPKTLTFDRSSGEVRRGERIVSGMTNVYEVAVESLGFEKESSRPYWLELRFYGGRRLLIGQSKALSLADLVEGAEAIASFCDVDLHLHPEVAKRLPC